MSIHTLNDLFLHALDLGRSECLLQPTDEGYQVVSSAELGRRVMRLEAAMHSAGVAHSDRVALMADNGAHWPTVDFATLAHGSVLVPVYPTLTAEQAAFIVNDCGAKLVVVQGQERLQGLLELAAEMPQVKQWVVIGESAGEIPTLEEYSAVEFDAQEFRQRAQRVSPDDLATFIYTSGTTGRPKGVMLSHGNLASNVVAGQECLTLGSEFVALSFLPLSHSFERTVDYIYFYLGITIAYAESVHTVARDLSLVNPHVFVSVPRVYEKVLAKVHESVSAAGGLREKLFHWAVGVGRQALPYRLNRTSPTGLLKLKLALADRLVFSKIRARLGSRFSRAVSGGAPLGEEVATFFWGAGIEIYEGYGLSETSPVLCVNRVGAARIGTVGPAIPGVELRITEDGEILARGPNIMRGYFNLPEQTAECFTEDGWFRSGDIGQIDQDGYLKITGRKKEILVNAYGKNIAPSPIENSLKASPLIEHAVVLGDRQKYLAAILVPDADNLVAWATKQGIAGATAERLVLDSAVQQKVAAHVESVNVDLARYQNIRKWELVPAEFSIDGGELTPTQKVKRRVIEEKYSSVINRLYDDGEPEIRPTGEEKP